MTKYQVVGECAHVTVIDPASGPAMQLLYKGAFVPEYTDAKRIEHLLKAGLIAAVDDDLTEAPLAANPSLTAVQAGTAEALKAGMGEDGKATPASQSKATEVELTGAATPSTVSADAVPVQFGEGAAMDAADKAPQRASTDDGTEAKREAARAKLPEDGSAPDGRASQEVWAEFMVTQGSAYEDVKGVSKQELKALHDSRQQS